MCVLLITRLLRGVGRWARKPVNHTSWVVVVTPTDRPKSVRNCCLIELFCGFVCVVTLSLWHFCWYRGFCHRTESYLLLFVFLWWKVNQLFNKDSQDEMNEDIWRSSIKKPLYQSPKEKKNNPHAPSKIITQQLGTDLGSTTQTSFHLHLFSVTWYMRTCISNAYMYIEKHQSNTIKSHKYVTTVVRLFQIRNIL